MQFKTLALATTSLVVLGFALAPAADAKAGGMMGRVDIDFSYYWDDWHYGGESSDDFSDEYTTVLGSGRVNIPYDDWYNIQADIFGGYSLDDNDGDGQFGNAGVGLHFNYRDPNLGLLGPFAALGRANGGGGEGYSGITYLAGFEGQYFCERWTFYGQVGYWDADDSDDRLHNAAFVRAQAFYYASPNLKLTGGLKYIDGDVGYDDYPDTLDSNAWDWILRIDYMFGKSMPVGAFFEYGGRSAETHNYNDEDTELDVNRVNIGVTFYLGGDEKSDLMYHDRMGASVSVPDFDEIRAPVGFIQN